jgi:hypothetical protein
VKTPQSLPFLKFEQKSNVSRRAGGKAALCFYWSVSKGHSFIEYFGNNFEAI